MSLTPYKSKRKFNKTPEPSGKTRSPRGPLVFVVQKHQASHLHYDFRLEVHGALKSWAIPKGPSLNPRDRRLAMMVEDHPYDYKDFEGVIPEGNYGAGPVMIWDQGTYTVPETENPREAERAMARGLEEGHLDLILDGEKLRGQFVLVRKTGGGARGNEWFLIKKHDEFASDADILGRDRSVVTGRSIEDIAGNEPPLEKEKIPFLNRAPKKSFRGPAKPMLATAVDRAFDNPEWLFEIKWDGYRALAEVKRGRVDLYSRNEISFTETFRPIAEDLKRLGHDAVLDGEIVVAGPDGRPSFQLLQNYLGSGEGQPAYYVFDILWLDGHDLQKLPLFERKQILRSILDVGRIKFNESIEEFGSLFFKVVTEQGLEGMVAKNMRSTYAQGVRSKEWLKIKSELRQEAVIAGFTEPRGSRKKIGALVLGVYDHGELRYIGHTGTGLEKAIDIVYEKLRPLSQKKSPFKNAPKTNMPVTWVKPHLLCEVKFREWTSEGHMRQPVFLGLREDKPPRDAVREPIEKGKVSEPKGKGAEGMLIEGNLLAFTNIDKIYWPEERYTKRDLVNYYNDVAPFILPYLEDRPENLHRFPDGITGESFYQKNMDHMPPDWIETVRIRSESESREINYLVCQDKASLLYMVNLGCIEMNPWNARVQELDYPDYMVLDLDPEQIPFAAVIETAQAAKKIFDSLKIPAYCKTSGATGLHICVPLGARYTHEQARQFGELSAALVYRILPKTTSLERSPKQRKGKVYLDYLQNRQGQTLAAPYSVRPRKGAPVSMPLAWNEVKKGLDPMKFTMKNALRRIAAKGDIWEPVLGPGVDLNKIVGF